MLPILGRTVMADKAWKQRERKIATMFKGVRNALSGGNSKVTRADVIRLDSNGQVDNSFPLFVEAKLRKKHTVVTLYDDTAVLAKKEKKIPVVVLAEKNRPGVWIVCRPEHMKAILEEME